VQHTMRLHMNEERERRLRHLLEATGENTKSKALDQAMRYYVRMRGNNTGVRTGTVEELMTAAIERGSLTPDEIAEILDCPELSVNYQREYYIGRNTHNA